MILHDPPSLPNVFLTLKNAFLYKGQSTSVNGHNTEFGRCDDGAV